MSFEVVVELDSIDMIKAYVGSGLGISVGPKMAIEPEDEEHLGIHRPDAPIPGGAGWGSNLARQRPEPSHERVHTNSGEQLRTLKDATNNGIMTIGAPKGAAQVHRLEHIQTEGWSSAPPPGSSGENMRRTSSTSLAVHQDAVARVSSCSAGL